MHYVVIVRTDDTADEDLGHYLANVGATLEPYGGQLLAFAPPQRLEGVVSYTKTAVLSFPSAEDARGWYDSPDYQELAAWRIGVMGHPVEFGLVPGLA